VALRAVNAIVTAIVTSTVTAIVTVTVTATVTTTLTVTHCHCHFFTAVRVPLWRHSGNFQESGGVGGGMMFQFANTSNKKISNNPIPSTTNTPTIFFYKKY
jgi:hypothetical protein